VTKGNVHDSKKRGPMIKEVAEEYDIEKVYKIKVMIIEGVSTY
jgi:hypothetical protein